MTISPFIEGTNYQWAWNSTSLSALTTCPRYYYYSIVEGWQPNYPNDNLVFGKVYQAAIELYEKQRADGVDFDDAVDAAIELTLAQSWIDGKPWASLHKTKNRQTLLRSIINYFDNYKDDPAKTLILANGNPAVELPFNFEMDEKAPNGEPYVLCGHLDRVVQLGEDFLIDDNKTTASTLSSYYFKQYEPNVQMSLYTLAAQVVFKFPVKGVLITAAQVLVGDTNFSRGITFRTTDQLVEFQQNIKQQLKIARHHADEGFWPMNESACNNYGGCRYRSVCSKDPSVREGVLRSDFTKAPRNPLDEHV